MTAATTTPTTTPEQTIAEARARIDALDDRIIGLIQERVAVSAVVQETRIASGGRRVSLTRENEILRHYSDALGKPGTALAMTLLELSRVVSEFGPALTRTARDRPANRFVGAGVRASQGRARKNHAWLAGAMRRTERAVRRGTSLQGRDRTAGDSSPVTQENGRSRGRPGPPGAARRKLQKCTKPDRTVAEAASIQHDA